MDRIFTAAFMLAFLAFSMPVEAQAFEKAVIAQLRQQGYSQISMTTTLLGRIRIVALSGDQTREIVMNPRTGEVLRDLWFSAADLGATAAEGAQGGHSGTSGKSSSGSGSSGHGNDDDDDDDDDDKDEDEDDDKDEDEDDDGGKGRGRGGDDD